MPGIKAGTLITKAAEIISGTSGWHEGELHDPQGGVYHYTNQIFPLQEIFYFKEDMVQKEGLLMKLQEW